jgi:hypothetical protein
MKKTVTFLALLAGLLLLGACAGSEVAPAAPAGNSSAATPEVVVYLSPT